MRRNRLAGTCGLQLVGERQRRIDRGAVGEIDVEPGLGERAHDRRADAPAPAGDEDAARHQRGSAARTRQVFWPPKPKEFESTTPTGASRASFGTTSRGIAGSGTR